jgi:hypothetical protein
MHYHFHLVSRHKIIPDEDGLEVTDLAMACKEVIKTVEEARRESPSTAEEWRGWRLDVADVAGTIVFSIRLDNTLH